MLPVRKIQTSLVAMFISVPALFGQYKLEQSVKIGKEQGFLSRDIRAIRKGNDGFMWIGTGEGLCRFDGKEVKYFKEGNDLEHSLFENSILAIIPTGDKLWIGTAQGISVLNTRDYTFRHYQLTAKRTTYPQA